MTNKTRIRFLIGMIAFTLVVLVLLPALRTGDTILNISNLLHRSKDKASLTSSGSSNSESYSSSTDRHFRHNFANTTTNVTKTIKTGSDVNHDSTNTNVKTRKDLCQSCFVHDFNYVIGNEGICAIYNDSQSIDLIIVICTTHKHRQERDALKRTWLTPTKRNTANVRYAFLLGETDDLLERQELLKESAQYGDIVKEDFVDSYENLTHKTIMGMKWATTKCSVAKYFMKTDDMYINLTNVLRVVYHRRKQLLSCVMGSCMNHTNPVRKPGAKWFISKESYPHDEYPDYCFGAGYITSIEVVRKIYEVSVNIPFFFIEDAYVGLCLQHIGYEVIDVPDFFTEKLPLDPCIFQSDRLYIEHGLTPRNMKAMWRGQCKKSSNYTT